MMAVKTMGVILLNILLNIPTDWEEKSIEGHVLHKTRLSKSLSCRSALITAPDNAVQLQAK